VAAAVTPASNSSSRTPNTCASGPVTAKESGTGPIDTNQSQLDTRPRSSPDPLPEEMDLEDQHARRDHARTVTRIDVSRALRQLSLEERDLRSLLEDRVQH
jgi:hypothetical protein